MIKDKIFYGWVIVATSLIIATTFFGIRLSFGVFFKSLESEFNLTRAATSSVFSIHMVLCAVFTMVGGWALDRYGPRLVIFIMGLLTGVSLLLTSQTSSLCQLFLSYSLLFAMGIGAAYPVLMSTVSRWFDKRRGLALGIAGSGGALGILIMAPFATYLISNLGWRTSYIVLGLIAWVVVISLSMILRKDPGEIGVLTDGAKIGESSSEAESREGDSQPTDLSLLQAFRTRNFWLLGAVWLLLSLCMNLVITHVVPYATDVGVSTAKAAIILSIVGGFSILSRALTGRVSDIVGRKVPGIICTLLQAGALVWLIWSQELWMFYLFAIVFGFSWGGLGTIAVTLVADNFGGRNLGLIMAATDVAFAIGAAIGPAIGGVIFDYTDSYTLAFAIGAAAMLITTLLLVLIRRETNTGIA